MGQVDDRTLVGRCRSGERRAFDVLVRRYGWRVYARLAGSVRCPEDVEDLVQEVFIRAYTRLGQLRDEDRFWAWLRTIADNEARAWGRRRAVQLRLEAALVFEFCGAPGKPEGEEAHLRAVVRETLRRLSEAHRQVVVHHYLKGYSYAETADVLGLNVEVVRSRLQKARRRLKKEMVSMSDQDVDVRRFDLGRETLEVLRHATGVVSKDPKRMLLQGMCIDTGGRVVATDGHRLLWWTCGDLRAVVAPVILGPWAGVAVPDGDAGTLELREDRAVLRGAGDRALEVSMIEGPYVKYDRVFPADEASFRVRTSIGALLEATELIQEYLAPKHLPRGEWRYKPMLEIRVSVPDRALSLVTRRDLGYQREVGEDRYRFYIPQEDGRPAPGGGPDWTFIASVDVEVVGGSEDLFRVHVDSDYWRTLFEALARDDREEALEVQFRGKEKAIVFLTVGREDRKALLMPLRLEPREAEA